MQILHRMIGKILFRYMEVWGSEIIEEKEIILACIVIVGLILSKALMDTQFKTNKVGIILVVGKKVIILHKKLKYLD